jgi:hypothetical protein
MYRYPVGSHVVLSHTPLNSYRPALAAGLVKHIEIPHGRTAVRMFLSDLVPIIGDDPEVFPDAEPLSRFAKEMRIVRTLANPVQVDDVWLSFENRPKKTMYEKTKTVVATLAVLGQELPRGESLTTVSLAPPAADPEPIGAPPPPAPYRPALDPLTGLPEPAPQYLQAEKVVRLILHHMQPFVDRLEALELALAMDGAPARTAPPENFSVASADPKFDRYVKDQMIDMGKSINALRQEIRTYTGTPMFIPESPRDRAGADDA